MNSSTDQPSPEHITELQLTASAIEKLAANNAAFRKAYDAYKKSDADLFEAALKEVGIFEWCRLVCRFFCSKHCGIICRKFSAKSPQTEANVDEIQAFAKAIGPLFQNEALIERFHAILESEDLAAWEQELKKNKLEIYAYQLCHFLCSWRCRKICHILCPPNPTITRIGSIPVSQIDAAGFGSGPSIPLFFVGPPNPMGGDGDHPFGGNINLMGVFNMINAKEFLVESSSTGPGGPYNTIIVGPQHGYNIRPTIPPPPVPLDTPGTDNPHARTRSQSIGADPGWFQVNQLMDSDGGRLTTGEKLLLTWPSTLPDGIYYLRLRVRDAAMNTRVSSPQVLRLDNTGPFPLPRPTIKLQLQKPDGTKSPLKCGKVHKGDGLILITIQAYDPNMSGVSVSARGNSGLTVPVVDITSTPLSRFYNGNLADQGYLVPTDFLWDPWSDPAIIPCCYLIYVEVNDRTIINNAYYGGHSNAGWEAIEIGL